MSHSGSRPTRYEEPAGRVRSDPGVRTTSGGTAPPTAGFSVPTRPLPLSGLPENGPASLKQAATRIERSTPFLIRQKLPPHVGADMRRGPSKPILPVLPATADLAALISLSGPIPATPDQGLLTGDRPVRRPPSDPPDHRHDPAHDRRLVAEDRRVRGVVGHQPDVPISSLEGLDRGLVVDPGGDDVAVVRVGLLTDHHEITVGGSSADHGIAPDLEDEQRPLADQLLGQGEGVIDDLLSRVKTARGDLAVHVNGNAGAVLGGNVKDFGQVLGLQAARGPPGQHDLYRARAARDTPEVALVLQGGKLVRDRGGAGQADRLADLTHGRGVGAETLDEPKDLLLPGGEGNDGPAGRPIIWRAAHGPSVLGRGLASLAPEVPDIQKQIR